MPAPLTAVRPATADDLPAVAAFDQWNAATDARLQAGRCFVVDGDDGRPVGLGVLEPSFIHQAFVAMIIVHPDHRRRGIASALLGHFEAITDRPKLWVSTNIENLGMQAVLHRRGYRLVGVIDELGDMPELFYVKVLGGSS